MPAKCLIAARLWVRRTTRRIFCRCGRFDVENTTQTVSSCLTCFRIAGVSAWFITIGDTIQSIPLTTFQAGALGIIGIGGVISAITAYHDAIHRFNSFSPP